MGSITGNGIFDENRIVAWGRVAANGTLQNGEGATVARVAVGAYQITFDSPLPNATYAVFLTCQRSPGRDSFAPYYYGETTALFNVEINEGDNGTAANVRRDGAFSFMVMYI